MQWIDSPTKHHEFILVSDDGPVIGWVSKFTPSPEDADRGYTHISEYIVPGIYSVPIDARWVEVGPLEYCMRMLEEFWTKPGRKVAV